MATVLYPYASGYVSSACDACGKFHELTGIGLDQSQSPPTPVFYCNYSSSGGGAPVLVQTVTIDQTSPLPAAVVAAIQSGAIVRS
jgi:hypothetical protein